MNNSVTKHKSTCLFKQFLVMTYRHHQLKNYFPGLLHAGGGEPGGHTTC